MCWRRPDRRAGGEPRRFQGAPPAARARGRSRGPRASWTVQPGSSVREMLGGGKGGAEGLPASGVPAPALATPTPGDLAHSAARDTRPAPTPGCARVSRATWFLFRGFESIKRNGAGGGQQPKRLNLPVGISTAGQVLSKPADVEDCRFLPVLPARSGPAPGPRV